MSKRHHPLNRPRRHPEHRCPECGRAGLLPWQECCPHRRACEARQMLQSGTSIEDAAAHAQNRSLSAYIDRLKVEREVWQPPVLPNDGRPRMYRVYGYRHTGDPRAPLGESLGQVGVGTTDQTTALALRDEWTEKRPLDLWVVEWSLL